jgi:hypothetical protein
MIGPTASILFQLGFAASTCETPESLNSTIGFRVRSHEVPLPGVVRQLYLVPRIAEESLPQFTRDLAQKFL